MKFSISNFRSKGQLFVYRAKIWRSLGFLRRGIYLPQPPNLDGQVGFTNFQRFAPLCDRRENAQFREIFRWGIFRPRKFPQRWGNFPILNGETIKTSIIVSTSNHFWTTTRACEKNVNLTDLIKSECKCARKKNNTCQSVLVMNNKFV